MKKTWNQKGVGLVLVLVFGGMISAMLLGLSVEVNQQLKKARTQINYTEIIDDLKEILLDNPQYWQDHHRGGPDAFIGAYIKRDLGYELPQGYMLCQTARQTSNQSTTLTVESVPFKNFHLKVATSGGLCRSPGHKPPNSYIIDGLELQYEGIARIRAEMSAMAEQIKSLQEVIKAKAPAAILATSAIEHRRRYGDTISEPRHYGVNNNYSAPTFPPNYYDGCMFCTGTDCTDVAARHGFPCISALGHPHTVENFAGVTEIPIFKNKKNLDVWGINSLTFSNKKKTCNDYTTGAKSGCFILRAIGPLGFTVNLLIAG